MGVEMAADIPADTMAKMEAIAKRAEDAAQSAADAAAAGPAARAAAKDEGAKQGWTDMPKELLDGIAAAASAMTVSALREEFEIQPPAADPTVPGSESGDATTSVMSGTSGSADTESSSSGISDPPPEGRKTLAQRMLGL
jgi:hypothetical protein